MKMKRLSNFAFYKTVGTEFGLTVPSMRKKYNIYLKYIWESDIKGLCFQRAPPPLSLQKRNPELLNLIQRLIFTCL